MNVHFVNKLDAADRVEQMSLSRCEITGSDA